MIMLVNTTPDRIPADEIAEQQAAFGEKFADIEGQAVNIDGSSTKK
jgi:hypothetical protein